MSCADVCLDHGADGFNEFYAERLVVARKVHRCCECGAGIAAGERYERATGKSDGSIWSQATCTLCVEIRSAFVCGSCVFGQLWESIEEEMFPRWRTHGPFDCMAKLTTAGARDYCRARFEEWEREQQ